MHRRQQHGVTVRARVVHALERDRLVDDRAHAVAHVAAQAQEVEAVLLVDEHRQPHLRLADVGERTIERTGRTGDHTGDVLAHLAGDVARLEIRRPRRHVVAEFGQLQGLVGAVAHAQATAHAGREEVVFGESAGRTDRSGRQRRRLLRVHPGTEREQARAAGDTRRILEEAAARRRCAACSTSGLLHLVVHCHREPAPASVPPVGGVRGSRLLSLSLKPSPP